MLKMHTLFPGLPYLYFSVCIDSVTRKQKSRGRMMSGRHEVDKGGWEVLV